MTGETHRTGRTAWTDDDGVGSEWVDEQQRMDRMLSPFGNLVLDQADLRPGERVLDVGCGTGALTAAAWEAVAPAGSVTGIDVSPAMLAAARDRLRHCQHRVGLICADAATHRFPPESVDAVISRFGVGHLVGTATALSRLAGALRPGGRLVFAEWALQSVNEWMTLVGDVARRSVGLRRVSRMPSHDPAFTNEATLRAALERAGLHAETLSAPTAAMWVGESVGDVMEWFGRLPDSEFLASLVPAQQKRFRDDLHDALAARATQTGVHLLGTAWIVTASPAA